MGNDYIIYINISNNIDKVIRLVKATSSNCTFFTTFVNIEKNCSITLYEDFIQEEKYENFINNVTRINLDNKTQCQHIVQKKFDGKVRFINTLEITCNFHAIYKNYAVNAIDISYRFESEVYLNAQKASASFYGVNIANNKQLYDIVIDIKHNASNTFSNQHYNQVLNNDSSGSFYSNVEISEFLNKVEAHQLNKNLLIDTKSRAYSRPILDIQSDDVVCSHGTTTGNLDKEALYYCTMRGISLELAKKLMILGLLKSVFLNSKLDSFNIEKLYQQIMCNIKLHE